MFAWSALVQMYDRSNLATIRKIMFVRILNVSLMTVALYGAWQLARARTEIAAIESRIESFEHKIGSIQTRDDAFSARQIATDIPNVFMWRCFIPPGHTGKFAIQTPDSNGSGQIASTAALGSPWFKPDPDYPALSPGDRFVATYVVCRNNSIGLKTITEQGHFGSYNEDVDRAVFLRKHLGALDTISYADEKAVTEKVNQPLKLLELYVPVPLRDEFEIAYGNSTSSVKSRNWRMMRFAFGSQAGIAALREIDATEEQNKGASNE